ncbi:MAG: hypothetical protein P1U82_24310 [Verrucomicrobiales bacterium]|nr:hypothetical protein [Verrucomicrobiales bacterium]
MIWQVGSFLDKRAKRERDLKNYEHTTQYDAHTFIYVKFHYWGLVAIGLGVFVYLTSVFDIFEGADSSQPKQQRSEQTSDGNP